MVMNPVPVATHQKATCLILKRSSDGRNVLVKVMRMFLAIYTSLEYLVKHNSSITLSMFISGGDVRTTSLAEVT